ncbi:Aspartyl-tRNA synthetase,mitochondrial, partial [Taphrina deformans PYCC 5710]
MYSNGSSRVVEPAVQLLKGWLEVPKRRVSQNLRFFRLRGYADTCSAKETTLYQLISRHPANSDLARRLSDITPESCVAVHVLQKLRPESAQRAQDGESGKYEFEIQDIDVLNPASPNIPFLPNNEGVVDSLVRAQHRQIEMRSDHLGSALRQRARLKSQLCGQLEKQGFMEVETPLLFKSTPEGAREFLVPTRKKGQFFALPQSPQQYKQILMAGGIHRYYQFAKCFRDEDSRADRQLEFTQLDLEMAFVEMEDVIAAISKIVLS